MPLEERAKIQTLSGVASGIVFIINALLLIVIRKFSEFEKHRTYTNLNTSVAFKLTIARFLNSSFVILAINWNNTSKWYNSGNLVFDATLLIMILMIFNPLMYLLDIRGKLKWIKRDWE